MSQEQISHDRYRSFRLQFPDELKQLLSKRTFISWIFNNGIPKDALVIIPSCLNDDWNISFGSVGKNQKEGKNSSNHGWAEANVDTSQSFIEFNIRIKVPGHTGDVRLINPEWITFTLYEKVNGIPSEPLAMVFIHIRFRSTKFTSGVTATFIPTDSSFNELYVPQIPEVPNSHLQIDIPSKRKREEENEEDPSTDSDMEENPSLNSTHLDMEENPSLNFTDLDMKGKFTMEDKIEINDLHDIDDELIEKFFDPQQKDKSIDTLSIDTSSIDPSFSQENLQSFLSFIEPNHIVINSISIY